MEDRTTVCRSCGHLASVAEMIPELTFSWVPTGHWVCRDSEACYQRWVAHTPPGGVPSKTAKATAVRAVLGR